MEVNSFGTNWNGALHQTTRDNGIGLQHHFSNLILFWLHAVTLGLMLLSLRPGTLMAVALWPLGALPGVTLTLAGAPATPAGMPPPDGTPAVASG